MYNARFALPLLALLSLAPGCKGAPDEGAPPGPAAEASAQPAATGPLGPLQQYALPSSERLAFDAKVVERLDAGSYGYLLVAREGSEAPIWVATLRPSVEVGARVRVTAFGRARDFDSRRLKRRFDELLFAAVRRA